MNYNPLAAPNETTPAVLNALASIYELIKQQTIVRTAAELEDLELEIIQATDNLAGAIIEEKVKNSLDDLELKKQASHLANSYPQKLKNQGPREVRIRALRGPIFRVKTNYYNQKTKKKSDQKRLGFYPALVLLGIYDHCTPGLASEISMYVALTSSFDEACQVLAKRGLIIDQKKIRDVSYRFAARVRAFQDHPDMILPLQDNLVGRRVVISTDGGRLRIRKNKLGQKTKKGRSRYSTAWREPKLLIIYTIDSEGKIDRSFAPFIDGTMGGSDEVFALIAYYLKHLQINQAETILFVADGAKWIWNRVPALFESLGLQEEQCYQLLDFYHAVEHLATIASLKSEWTTSQRKRWLTTHRRLLLKGQIKQVIEAISRLLPNGPTKALTTELNYFINNSHRMNYALAKQMAFPLGSGAMESAIRRVINLKLKGAAIFWQEEAADALLLLRSFFKSGRWSLLKRMAFANFLPLSD